jgi:DNA-binding NarL/FixJ family response regulator
VEGTSLVKNFHFKFDAILFIFSISQTLPSKSTGKIAFVLEVIADSIRNAMTIAESKSSAAWVDSQGSSHENAFASVLSAMTDTQIETLRLVATGLSNAEIGRVRFVSEKSVEQIVARIAGHFAITPDRTRNLRVLIAGHYYKWIGAPRH